MRFWVAALVWASGVAAPASAQGWDDYLAPDAIRGERLFARAMEHVACALRADECALDVDALLGPEVEWEQALVRLDRARRYLPGDPDVLFFRAIALARWERDGGGGIERRVPEAIAAFEELRALHPAVSPSFVAFELAILRTRQRDYAGAAAEYEAAAAAEMLPPVVPAIFPTSGARTFNPSFYAVGLQFVPIPIQQTLGNWAEVTMLSGDADRAIELYERAVEAEGSNWPNGALARFGLALALDRSGAHDAALAATTEALDVEAPRESPDDLHLATRALVSRWGSFAPLHAEGVFFEPECEIRAYEALGHEALAAQASGVEGRHARLESALRSWRAFLTEGGRDGLWATRAEENVRRLEALIAR